MESIEEPVPLTASQIAMEHFTRELIAHAKPDSTAETVVILHDACYGHRYSRPKTSKSILSMIVERPERIHASILGASTAYVRLGGHHAGERNAPHPEHTEPAPPPFKIRRTDRSMDITSSHVTNVHGTAWMTELQSMCNAAGQRLAEGAKELSRSSTPTDPEKRKLHEGDLYLCSESLNAFQGALGGVADAVDTVFAPASQTKRAFVAVRPPGHHCSADYPSGFCWLNNVHVGIEYAAQTSGLTHAAILDFDLHHGDGSQAITWERNSKNNEKRLNAKPNSKLKLGPDIGYYSLHDINSYPCEAGDDDKVQAASLCIDNAHGQNVWNVHLKSWTSETEFWQLYETQYRVLLDKARGFLRSHTARLKAEGKTQPKAAIFVSAGFDASEWEGAGMQRHKVSVPTEFYSRFTQDVVELAKEDGTGCDGRVISVLEGGYSDRALCSGVLSHLSGLCATPAETVKTETSVGGLDQMMRGLGINGNIKSDALSYDKTWWSAENLTALELKVNPPPLLGAKKVRTGQQPTYATPTESFAYKVVDANKFARSISGTMRDVQKPARPPTPPPPEVDWVVATQELLKLFIPTDRQTRSCTPEELGGVRAKKENASALPVTTAGDFAKPRQLRDRKSKAPAYPEGRQGDELENLRSVSRNSRRQTIADLPSSSDQPEPAQQRRASRRLSAGSTLSSIGGDLDPNPPPVPAFAPTMNGSMKPPSEPASGVQVKKTRAPAKPKNQALANMSSARSTDQVAGTSGPANTTAPVNNDVDALTSGMKKVTLKVGTKEEHDRKQKEKVDAERRARALKAAETRKANAAAKKAAKDGPTQLAKSGAGNPPAKENTVPEHDLSNANFTAPSTMNSAPANHIPSVAEPIMSSPMLPNYSAAGTSTEPYATLTTDSPSRSGNPVLQQEQQQPALLTMEHTLPHETPTSNQPPSPLTVKKSESPKPDSPARQLIQENSLANGTAPPTMASFFSPVRSPNGILLPVWSSTSTIPFAAKNGIPNTPLSPSKHSADGSRNGEVETMKNVDVSPEHVVGGGSTAEDKSPKVDVTEDSIWDVPETPPRAS